MLASLSARIIRHAKGILIGAGLLLIVCAVVGPTVVARLSNKGFDNPSSESVHAQELMRDKLNLVEDNVILVFTPKAGRSAVRINAAGVQEPDPEFQKDADVIMAALTKIPNFQHEYSYWTVQGALQKQSFLACQDDGTQCQALAFAIINDTESKVYDEVAKILKAHESPYFKAQYGGQSAIEPEITETISHDLLRAEMIGFPLTLLLLILVFRSLVAAVLPLLIGGFAIVGTLVVLLVISHLTTVSVFAMNLTSMLGLGLAIDYSLFVVSRFREELRTSGDVKHSVQVSMETAGRTITFSGIAVAVSLAALLVFPQPILRSMAYAGIAVAVIALIGALVILPALLTVIGHNINRYSLQHSQPKQIGEGAWARIARVVMRFALPLAILVTALLVAMVVPARNAHFSTADQRVLYKGAQSRDAMEAFAQFTTGKTMAADIILENVPNTDQAKDAVDNYAQTLQKQAGALIVVTPRHTFSPFSVDAGSDFYRAGTTERIQVVTLGGPFSYKAENFVREIRTIQAPYKAYVGGQSARLVDNKEGIKNRIPVAILLIASVTFLALMLMFGSILVPIKALVLNTLSLMATFGVMVWIFQEGGGGTESLLHFTRSGMLEMNIPVVMFCVAFGLSMDYEVFMLSRIREEYEIDHDNERAVAYGLQRTGRIVTAAALLLAIVFLAFATSRVSLIKMFGIGLTLAVLLDATLVRALLVPSFMKLAGQANWWAPAPIKRLATRFGWHD